MTEEEPPPAGAWACPACTFLNLEGLHLTCAVCGTPRQKDSNRALQQYQQKEESSSDFDDPRTTVERRSTPPRRREPDNEDSSTDAVQSESKVARAPTPTTTTTTTNTNHKKASRTFNQGMPTSNSASLAATARKPNGPPRRLTGRPKQDDDDSMDKPPAPPSRRSLGTIGETSSPRDLDWRPTGTSRSTHTRRRRPDEELGSRSERTRRVDSSGNRRLPGDIEFNAPRNRRTAAIDLSLRDQMGTCDASLAPGYDEEPSVAPIGRRDPSSFEQDPLVSQAAAAAASSFEEPAASSSRTDEQSRSTGTRTGSFEGAAEPGTATPSSAAASTSSSFEAPVTAAAAAAVDHPVSPIAAAARAPYATARVAVSPRASPSQDEETHASNASRNSGQDSKLMDPQIRPGAYAIHKEAGMERQVTGFISPQDRVLDAELVTDVETVVATAVTEEQLHQESVQEGQMRLEEEMRNQMRNEIMQEAPQAVVVTSAEQEQEEEESPRNTTTTTRTHYIPPPSNTQAPRGNRRNIDIGSNPQLIRTRESMPIAIARSSTTRQWIVHVDCSQKALEAGDSIEIERCRRSYAFPNKKDAEIVAKQLAPPRMLSYDQHPNCHLCKNKFGMLRRPCHCRNCGVCICSSCATSWNWKMVPETFNLKAASSVNVCLACDWLSTSFRSALLDGNYSQAVDFYKTGNINVGTPFCNVKGETMYPTHCAVLSGSLKLLKWLMDDLQCGFLATPASRTMGGRTVSPASSRNRTPLSIALKNDRTDIVHYLVVAKKQSLYDEKEISTSVLIKNLEQVLLLLPTDIAEDSVKG